MVHPVDAYFSLAHESMILKIFDAKIYGLKKSKTLKEASSCRAADKFS
jgi:hypothetical protein